MRDQDYSEIEQLRARIAQLDEKCTLYAATVAQQDAANDRLTAENQRLRADGERLESEVAEQCSSRNRAAEGSMYRHYPSAVRLPLSSLAALIERQDDCAVRVCAQRDVQWAERKQLQSEVFLLKAALRWALEHSPGCESIHGDGTSPPAHLATLIAEATKHE